MGNCFGTSGGAQEERQPPRSGSIQARDHGSTAESDGDRQFSVVPNRGDRGFVAANDGEPDLPASSSAKLDPVLPGPVRRLRRELADQYVRAKVKLDSGMAGEGVDASVASVHVNLIILSRQELRNEFQNIPLSSEDDMLRVEHVFSSAGQNLQSQTLEEMFELAGNKLNLNRTCGVLAIASAGCGKTFIFTQYVPHRWATGGLWPEFDLVVVKELRYKEDRCAANLSELLELDNHGIRSNEDQDDICEYARQNPSRVCIVFDGLDETSLQDCSKFVQKIINGEVLQGIRLIVTSRPCSDAFTLAVADEFEKRVELVGFRPDGVETYVRKVLNHHEASELMHEVRNDSHLANMMTTPLIALQTCRMYHSRGEVPRCVSDIFNTVILQVAERRARKTYTTWSDVPDWLQKQILELGAFAFNMLMERHLIFTESDIQKHSMSDPAISLGLLVACDPSPQNNARYWRFSHLTMQESLAAKYQAYCRPVTESRLVRLVESLGPDSGHCRTFWILLMAQLPVKFADVLARSLLTRERVRNWDPSLEEEEKDDGVVPLEQGHFPLNFVHALCAVLSQSQTNRLAEELLCKAIGGSGQALVENSLRRGKDSNADFLTILLQTWTRLVPSASEEMLFSTLDGMQDGLAAKCQPDMQCSDGHCADSRPRTLPETADFRSNTLRSRLWLVFHCFSEFSHHSKDACQALPTIAAALEHKTCTIEVDVGGSAADLRALRTVVEHHPKGKRHIKLKWAEDIYWLLPSQLELRSILSFIDPDGTTVPRDLLDVLQISPLHVEGFQATSGNAEVIPWDRLSVCTELKSLKLYSDFSSSDIECLVNTVAELRNLNNFELAYNDCSDGMPLLCQALGRSTMMEKVSLVGCGQLHALSAAIRLWPCLQELKLQCNNFSAINQEQVCEFVDAINSCRSPSLAMIMMPPIRHSHPCISEGHTGFKKECADCRNGRRHFAVQDDGVIPAPDVPTCICFPGFYNANVSVMFWSTTAVVYDPPPGVPASG